MTSPTGIVADFFLDVAVFLALFFLLAAEVEDLRFLAVVVVFDAAFFFVPVVALEVERFAFFFAAEFEEIHPSSFVAGFLAARFVLSLLLVPETFSRFGSGTTTFGLVDPKRFAALLPSNKYTTELKAQCNKERIAR